MVNLEKLRLKSQIVVYEKGQGKDYIKLGKYFSSNRKYFAIITNLLTGALIYCTLLALRIVFYYVLNQSFESALLQVISVIIYIACGIIFAIAYHLLIESVLKIKFENVRNSLWSYSKNVSRLEKLNSQLSKENENIT